MRGRWRAELVGVARARARGVAATASTSSAMTTHYECAPSASAMAIRRVVVTGVGVVTPLGRGVGENMRALVRGSAGARALEVLDVPEIERGWFDATRRTVAGVADARVGFDRARWCEGDRYAKFVGHARCAAHEAIEDAGLMATAGTGEGRDDVGVSVGSGMGGVSDLTRAGALMARGELRKISPYFVPRILANAAAGRVSMDHGFRGPNLAATTACATSAHCIGDAFRALQRGEASVMIAGGTEGCIDLVSLAGFAKARALSASGIARPFDSRRDGFVMGEGAGILVLETLEHARARGATKIYAEVRGYAASGDAYHVTRASPDGEGAARAMRAAMRDAGIVDPLDIGYVNAHATGTPLGDAAETMALKSVFGARAIESGDVLVTSTKGATGHLLGAAGAVEAAYAIMALHTGEAPPTVGYYVIDESLNIPIVGGASGVSSRLRPSTRAVVTNSFGFGGTNASLIFAKPPPLDAQSAANVVRY